MLEFFKHRLVAYLIKLWLLTVLIFGPICVFVYEWRNVKINPNIPLSDYIKSDLLIYYGIAAVGGIVSSLPVLIIDMLLIRKLISSNYSWFKSRLIISVFTMISVLVFFLLIDGINRMPIKLIYVLAVILSTISLLVLKKNDKSEN